MTLLGRKAYPMTTSIMTEAVSQKRLHEIYATDDFYWYLRSEPFIQTFLVPLAERVNNLGNSCLDVACGEGQLSPLIDVIYCGVDASVDAIQKAKAKYKEGGNRQFIIANLESFPEIHNATFDTIVCGGIFHTLIKPDQYVTLLEMYLKFNPKFFIVYDLEILECSAFSKRFRLIEEIHASVDMPNLLEVKRHRKILVYKCSS